jgi:hypothetical protein
MSDPELGLRIWFVEGGFLRSAQTLKDADAQTYADALGKPYQITAASVSAEEALALFPGAALETNDGN